MKTIRIETLTPEQAELYSIYQLGEAAFERETEKLLARWVGTALRRMRLLVRGAEDAADRAEGMQTFDDLLNEAERYGLSAVLQGELDWIRDRFLFRMNQGRVPNRHAG